MRCGYDLARSLVQIKDGGYAFAGETNSYTLSVDFWLVKTDVHGNVVWSKTYGGKGTDSAQSLVWTADGGYALAGYTDSEGAGGYDFWLVKTDSAGKMQWSKTYGGTGNDWAFSLVQTDDGGYALARSTASYGAGIVDFWLVKTDASGNMLWNQTYGDAEEEEVYSLVQTNDCGYALTGFTYSYGAVYDFWLVKTDASGNMLWNQTYGGADYDGAYSLVQIEDGSYALAGYTKSYGAGEYDLWLVKVDAEKNREHKRNFSTETGLAWTGLTNKTITLYRGETDPYWNYVRVRIWTIEEPSWIYGDINMDGIVDAKDLYILGRNYGKTFSLLSLSGIVAVAGIHTVKKRKQPRQRS